MTLSPRVNQTATEHDGLRIRVNALARVTGLKWIPKRAPGSACYPWLPARAKVDRPSDI